MPDAGTGGAEVGEEAEDATGWGGPLLSELHTPKIRQSSDHTRQTWRRRGKWTHNVETCSGGGSIQSIQCKIPALQVKVITALKMLFMQNIIMK